MRATEFINEASRIPDDFVETLTDQGYKKLGRGADQVALMAPDGSVLKIFGVPWGSPGTGLELTRPQKVFKAFVDFCNANRDNPFLPQFSDWQTTEFDGDTFILVKMERLFPFTGTEKWASFLESIADRAQRINTPEEKEEFIDDHLNADAHFGASRSAEVFSHLGDEGFNLLWDTIYQLGLLGKQLGLRQLDLHEGNFMVTDEGQIVIADPFYTGD